MAYKFTRLAKGNQAASGAGYAFRRLSEKPTLSAPVISRKGDTLTISDESSLAEQFEILVDGEVVATVSAVTLITFTIDGSTYQAEEGMTWGEWVADTTYNTDGYLDQNGFVAQNAIYMVCDSSVRAVTIFLEIEANHPYITSSEGIL